jgi:pseudaminic acid biosynthesis-associated methylase
MDQYKTEQERLWAGAFGDEYITRNKDKELIRGSVLLFSRVFARTQVFNSLIEFGPNVGMNLRAIQLLFPKTEFSAIEINDKAVGAIREWNSKVKIYHQSILDFTPDFPRDLVLIKGVLSHTNPDQLQRVYEKLYSTSGRYICVIEAYNTNPITVPYRGQQNALFKRDFAGEMLDSYPNLELLDYGFAYQRDPLFSVGDVSWFLLEKRNN